MSAGIRGTFYTARLNHICGLYCVNFSVFLFFLVSANGGSVSTITVRARLQHNFERYRYIKSEPKTILLKKNPAFLAPSTILGVFFCYDCECGAGLVNWTNTFHEFFRCLSHGCNESRKKWIVSLNKDFCETIYH